MRKTLMMGFVALLILPLGRVGAEERRDLLLTQVYDGQGGTPSLNVYDPATNVTTPLPDYIVSNVQLSADGRLAYSVPFEGRIEVHIWDSNHPDQFSSAVMAVGDGNQYPLMWSADGRLAWKRVQDGEASHPLLYVWDGTTSADITPPEMADTVTEYERLAWSADGRYLAFGMFDENTQRQIYVWDGTTAALIYTEANPDFYEYALAWSPDDRLAIRVTYSGDSPNAIYIWDGHNTMRLSQNPTQYPVWSADGRLAFQSVQDGAYDILVWDGESLKDGLPDVNTFANIAPDLTADYSVPVWTSQNQVAFEAKSFQDSHSQIYVWDGEQATNISQNPTVNNSNAVWSRDGRWAFTNYASPEQFVYVRDADNQSVLMTKGYGYTSKPAWSSSGDLLFCRLDQPDWVLVIWDGQAVQEVARGASIFAQWQNGSNIICSSG